MLEANPSNVLPLVNHVSAAYHCTKEAYLMSIKFINNASCLAAGRFQFQMAREIMSRCSAPNSNPASGDSDIIQKPCSLKRGNSISV
jgi:hypothetical protein